MTRNGNYFSALESLSTEASPASTKASYAWQTPVCEQGHLLACAGFEFMKRATKADLVIHGSRCSTEMANRIRRFYGQRLATSSIDDAPMSLARLLRALGKFGERGVRATLLEERIHAKLHAAFLQCLHNDGLIKVSFDATAHVARVTLTDEGLAWSKMKHNQAPDVISSWADEMDDEDDRSVSVNRASAKKLAPPVPVHID